MGETFDEKLLGFLKRHPHVVERFVKENCTADQLNDWIVEIKKRSFGVIFSPNATNRESSDEQLVTVYQPLISSAVLSQKLVRVAKFGNCNKETIFSHMTASILECVMADGSNLYLRDSGTNLLYVQPMNKAITGYQEGTQTFDISSRQNVACCAAEKKEQLCSDCLPDGISLSQLSTCVPNAKHVVAQPIVDANGVVIGVIELYRWSSDKPFTPLELQLIQTNVQWAQVVLEGTQRVENSEKSIHLADFIMEVTRNLFSQIKNMDSVIKVIMQHAKQLVKAERVTLFLVDHKKNELYSSILDMGDVNCAKFVEDEGTEIRLPINEGIVGYVARTGIGIRSNDAYSDERFYRKVDEATNQVTKTILAMPLTEGKEVLGVIEMINKYQGAFTEEDESLLKVYCTYCGLAINVARMYDRIYRSDRKYRVALEVLTYHSCVSAVDVENALPCEVPEAIPGITSCDFSPWDVEESQEVPTILYMMYDLAGKPIFDKTTLLRFILTVRKNYRPVAYHNWDHGFSVAHSMYYMLKSGENHFNLLERICLFIACLCHDLDHRGFDNRFMKKFSTPLASLYSSSPMEHHHFNMTITILQQRDHNIFRNFRNASYRTILGIIKHAILSTDLAVFWGSKNKLDELLDSENGLDWSNHDHKMAIIAVGMPMCDLCAMYKPWDIQVKVVTLIMQEFWAQGDQEKASDSKPLSLMDRDEATQLADGQVGFIRAICVPCYTTIARVFPHLNEIVDVVKKNMTRWEQIASLPHEDRERILQEQMAQRFTKIANRSR